MIPLPQQALLRKQGYKLVGKHSAVKPCTWLHKSLFDKGYCYKQQFYGIKSHRCLQCTPAVAWCKHSCLFCWRPLETTQPGVIPEEDDPEILADKLIQAQREFIIGYKNAKGVNKQKWEEAMNPNQVALSLAGEPTTYSKLGGLIKAFHNRGATTFLVTNGTNPEALRRLNPLPTQLYITLPAPDPDTYLRTCAPREYSWEQIKESLRIMSKLRTRRVIRLTVVRGLNLHDSKGYANLIRIANPDWVEVKAYMSVGSARKRLPYSNMPSHDEILLFAKKLAQELSQEVLDDKKDSRVALIGSKNPLIKEE